MKMLLVAVAFFSAAAAAGAQPEPSNGSRPAAVVHHSVSSNAAAAAAFDRGLLDYYAYNPDAAEHEFYTAADLDPHMAMAYWGIALSNAPNLNVPATDDRDAQARLAIERACALEAYASPEDRLFIDAAAARFDDKTKAAPNALLVRYRDALRKISEEYPNDPDAAALYAEAALYAAVGDVTINREGWSEAQRAVYTAGVARLLPFFQTNLAKFPAHVGLLHFYIHAAQIAQQSQAAVSAATELASFELPPQDSHLTHMPGHTFFDVGMYDAALDAGQRSVAMDEAAIACCHPGYYSAARYYHLHNVAFLLYAMTETGHGNDAVDVARKTGNASMIARSLVAAGDWQGALDISFPKGSRDLTPAFTRALAYAKLGEVSNARAALAAMPAPLEAFPSRVAIAHAMKAMVEAQIALDSNDTTTALRLLTNASADAARGDWLAGPVEMPTLYYYSPHMVLAQLAMKMGDAALARSALEAELKASPRSGAATAALKQLGGSQ